jgi:hypothetical protein
VTQRKPKKPLESADRVLLRHVFENGPLVVKLGHKDQDQLDRLVLDGYLTAWLVTDVMLYAMSDAGLAALKRKGK